MKTLVSAIVLAGLAGFGMTTHAAAQERALRSITRGEAAPLQKSMTQAQARKLCAQQMRGARESARSKRQKMAICIRRHTEGV